MKKFAKILVFIVAVALVFGVIGVSTFAVDDHSDGITLYLKPNSNWTQSNARFAVYTWDGGDKWFNLTSAGDGYYTVTLPAGISNIIFCRMNPSTTANNWNNKWNQTADLKVQTNGNNCYTVAAGAWDKGGGTWSKFTCAHTNVAGSEVVLKAPTCTETGLTQYTCSKCGNYTVVTEAKGHTYTNNKCTVCGSMASYTVAGANSSDAASIFGTAWDTTNTANDMTYDEATGAYTKVYTNVPAGTYKFKCAQDHAWNVAYPGSDKQVTVSKAGSTLTITLKGTTVTTSVVAPVAKIGTQYFFDLQEAIDAAVDGDTVVLLANYTGDIYFTRAADVDVTINGNGNTFKGAITIDGKSATYATGSLTIENVRFDATGISKAASINFGVSGNNNTRYITNVSIIKCTFTGGNREKAAIKSYTGGDYNVVIAGCTVDNTMHSLVQAVNVTGLEIDACTVYSKNGINLNNSSDVVVKNSTIEVSGYALRAGAGSDGTSGAVELTNNTLKTDNTEGDPVIVIRGLAQKNIDLVMTENVVSGDVHIGGTTADTKVSAEANYWDGKTPVVKGTAFKVLEVYTDEAKTTTAVAGLQGNGTEADPFLINNVDELVWFRDQVDLQLADGTTQFAGKYFKLTADIDLAGINWDPIGSMTGDHGSFKGVFDGDGHTISNLYVEQAGNGLGFFARITGNPESTVGNPEIKNLNFVNVTVKSTNDSSYVGGVVGNCFIGNINNVHVSGDILISGRGYIGGIVGHGYVVMDNVSVKGNEGSLITSTFWCAGGILGYSGENVTNIMNANVEGVTIKSAAGGLGAIVGMASANNSGSNLSASNVKIETYIGAYGDAYATYCIGYLYGGNTSNLTGELVVENVVVATSNGKTPAFADAVAVINGTDVYFDYNEAFKAAKNGDVVSIVKPGTYKLAVSGKNVTVTGAVDGVAFEGMGEYNMGGANVTFNNITFNWTNDDYRGLQHSGNLVYNNCTINGQVFLYGNSEIFNECTFNQTSAAKYNVWTYGAKYVEFNKCTFNSAGKALLVYTESATHFIDLAITETTFNASAVAAGKAAIEIDTSLTAGANISIDAVTTANGFDAGNVSGNTLWNNKKGNATDKNNDIIITVAGEEVLAPLPYEVTIGSTKYTSIQAAIDAAKSGDEISIYNDLVLTNSLYINNKTVTINLNKHTLTYGGTNLRAAAAIAVLTNNATLIVKGNGTVLTNGAIFSIEDGSEVQIVDGTYDVDVTPYLAEGYRVATAPQADGTILYGVVTNTDKTFIGENGNWWVGEYDTGIAAQPKVEIIEVDGVKYWHVNGINTGYLVTPTDAVTPEIKVIDGVWHIDIKDGNGFQSTSIVAGAVDGNGIVSIEKTESNGLIDIYTITYNDGTTTMFTIQNGSNGANGPTGPDGIPGNQGPKGNRGEPGANGASNTWFVNSALYIALGCIALAGGVVLVLNYKRTHWWG